MLRSEMESETAAHQLARLEKLIPPEKLAAILRRLADRAEEQRRKRTGGALELTLHFDGAGRLAKVTERLDGRVA